MTKEMYSDLLKEWIANHNTYDKFIGLQSDDDNSTSQSTAEIIGYLKNNDDIEYLENVIDYLKLFVYDEIPQDTKAIIFDNIKELSKSNKPDVRSRVFDLFMVFSYEIDQVAALALDGLLDADESVRESAQFVFSSLDAQGLPYLLNALSSDLYYQYAWNLVMACDQILDDLSTEEKEQLADALVKFVGYVPEGEDGYNRWKVYDTLISSCHINGEIGLTRTVNIIELYPELRDEVYGAIYYNIDRRNAYNDVLLNHKDDGIRETYRSFLEDKSKNR